MQTHFVNVGSLETNGEGKVMMNLNDADPGTITDHAGALFGQDRDVVRPAAEQHDRVRGLRVPQGHQPDRADRPLPLPRPPLQHLRMVRRPARRRDLPLRGLRRSALPRLRSAAAGRGAARPGVGVLLGEPERRRLQVRPVHRHQRALQPVRLLLPDRHRRTSRSPACATRGSIPRRCARDAEFSPQRHNATKAIGIVASRSGSLCVAGSLW